MRNISILLVASCVLGCLVTSNEFWEIVFETKLSEKSRFYVLHDWSQGVYGPAADWAPFPVSQISDIMLKTMGIWKDGVSWEGVKLGNLFSRPRATALFVLDGLSDHLDVNKLSEQEYSVDAGSLNGNVEEDTSLMFASDSIMNHFRRLFEGKSLSLFVSGEGERESSVSEENSIFDLNSIEDVGFLGELAVMRNTVRKLSMESIEDGNPDVMVFSFSTIKTLQAKYGSDSKQMAVAMKMVTDTIKELTDTLVDLYQGDIIVQAVVLQWSYPDELDGTQTTEIKQLLHQYFTPGQVTVLASKLPTLSLPNMDYADKLSLCADLAAYVEDQGGHLRAQCNVDAERNRLRRSVASGPGVTVAVELNAPGGITSDRDEDFPAVFLMIFVTVVPLALALFAISWAMWNMDPGLDSIIYRNTDMQGIKLQ